MGFVGVGRPGFVGDAAAFHLPIRRAVGPVSSQKIERLGGTHGGGEDANAGLPQAAENTSQAWWRSSAMRRTLPAEARTAFGFHWLTVPGRAMMPLAPKASAERRIVPRLPGSCRPGEYQN